MKSGSFQVNEERFARALSVSSLLYLAAPCFLFFFGWFRVSLGLLLGGLLAGAIWFDLRFRSQGPSTSPKPEQEEHAPTVSFSPLSIGVVVSLILVWVCISGIGGIGAQTYDYFKHNAILKDLVSRPWPVIYPVQWAGRIQDVPLVYNVAYYLPSALCGKLAGDAAAKACTFVLGLIGVTFSLLWFCLLIRRFSGRVALLFVFFSGLDSVGLVASVLVFHWLPIEALNLEYIADWLGLTHETFVYRSHSFDLFWAPQHALPCWILTGILLYRMLRSKRPVNAIFLHALAFLWSPFAALGMAPFVLLACLARRLREALTLPNGVGVLMGIVFGLFYLSKRAVDLPCDGILFEPSHVGFLKYVVGCLLEFGVYAGFILYARSQFKSRWDPWVFWVAMGSLLVIPLFRVGQYNDLSLRVSIPGLGVVAMYSGVIIVSRSLHRGIRAALVVLLCLGAVTPVFWWVVQVSQTVGRVTRGGRGELAENVGSILEIPSAFDLARQYVGGTDSVFFRHLARRNTASDASGLVRWSYDENEIRKVVEWRQKRHALLSALSRDPRNVDLLVKTGFLYLGWEHVLVPLHLFRQALAIDPQCVEAHFGAGICLEELGHLGMALSHLEDAARLKPSDPEVALKLADIYMMVGRQGDAVMAAGRAMRLAEQQGRSDLHAAAARRLNSAP